MEEFFTCKRDGLEIRGMQFRPEGPGRYPILIASHGFTGNYTDMIDTCRYAADLGYAAFCFSFCGGGRRTDVNVQSQGASTDMTIQTEAADLIAVKDYAKALEWTESGDITLLGESQGGLVSGLVGGMCPEEISRLVLIYPALCIPDHARRGILAGASYDVNHVPERIESYVTTLGRCIHDGVVGMDPYLELERFRGPVLILHGTKDTVVDYTYSVRLQKCYAPGQCRLQLIQDAGHGFTPEQKRSSLESIREFLLGHREVLAIRVLITGVEVTQEHPCRKQNIWFTGYCEHENFRGTVLPGGCDAQVYEPDGTVTLRAEYTLEGIDPEGKTCRIHIVNKSVDGKWKPTIDTDSQALAWMNEADFTAVLEHGPQGPVVRIFCR